jgi:hypothetical protein
MQHIIAAPTLRNRVRSNADFLGDTGKPVTPVAFLKSDRGKADRRIAEARGRLARQRKIVQKLVRCGYDASDAEALCAIIQWTIEILEEERRVGEDETLSAKDPCGERQPDDSFAT